MPGIRVRLPGRRLLISVSHKWNRYEDGGTSELSLIEMGQGGIHCTGVRGN